MASVKKEWKVYDGKLTQYTHHSTATNTPMQFSVFVPPSSSSSTPSNVLFWLSGLTCTDENFAQKATIAFKAAAYHNLVLVLPDTSPRGETNCPGDEESWDFGKGAGFYLNATTQYFKEHYNMYDYVTDELWNVVQSLLGDHITSKRGIFGHSMGGLGALNLYLKSGKYSSCSAFAPISNPTQCPWGVKAFTRYLGEDKSTWEEWDPSHLVAKFTGDKHNTIKIDQGSADNFYTDKQLLPEAFLDAAAANGVTVEYRFLDGYDHGYFFIHSFVVEHIEHHAKILNQ